MARYEPAEEEHSSNSSFSYDDARPWPTLRPAALYGLAGEFVRLVEPHSEADPVAVLAQFLIGAGNAIGRGPCFVVEATRHRLNEFAVLVGATSRSRKGTSRGHVERILSSVDKEWSAHRILSGLSSGEGLIWAVRDPIEKRNPIKKGGRTVDYETVIEDVGVADKRLLVIEEEFARVLKVAARDGNTLSPTIRCAWDKGKLQILTKNTPASATDAHISIIGHITVDELRRSLSNTESANGFANRFLWLCVRRSKRLPEGGAIDRVDFAPLLRRLICAIEFARNTGELTRDEEARAVWREFYNDLPDEAGGLGAAITARAEAHVTRLSCLYALLDSSPVVTANHLHAALALWQYADDSARCIFGDSLGDPVADEILRGLRASPNGMTRTEISGLLGRNVIAARISSALVLLKQRRLAYFNLQPCGGRTIERWFAAARNEIDERNERSEEAEGHSSSLSSNSYDDNTPHESLEAVKQRWLAAYHAWKTAEASGDSARMAETFEAWETVDAELRATMPPDDYAEWTKQAEQELPADA